MGTNVKLYVFLLHTADDPVSFIYLLFVAVLRRLTLAYPRVAVIICSVYAFTSVRAFDYSLTELGCAWTSRALCCVPPVLNLRVVIFAREVPLSETRWGRCGPPAICCSLGNRPVQTFQPFLLRINSLDIHSCGAGFEK